MIWYLVHRKVKKQISFYVKSFLPLLMHKKKEVINGFDF